MIYICSDIHGRYDRYQKLLEKISLQENDTLYILGDMIDRGDDGIEILLDMMKHRNIVPFLGNHEHMMLMYLFGYDKVSWLNEYNGGAVTLEKFLKLSDDDKRAILEYIDQSYVLKTLEIGGHRYSLSHIGIITGEEERITNFTHRDTDVYMLQDMVWGEKQYALGAIHSYPEELCPTTFLTGHIITRRYDPDMEEDEVITSVFPNGCRYIDLDCGCAMGEDLGRLGCVKIDEETGEIDLDDVIYVA